MSTEIRAETGRNPDQISGKRREGLLWVAAHEGVAPARKVSAVVLTWLRAEGLAEPNQPTRRKPQEDAWWLTPLGRRLVVQIESGRADAQRIRLANLTRNQRAVLEKLSGAEVPLFGRDFADIASVQHGRWEWAGPILARLRGRGLVKQVGTKTWKGTGWRITEAGRKALKVPDPAPRPAPTGLTQRMRTILSRVGRAFAAGEPYESVTDRTTHEALERRGLVTITTSLGGWRRLTLTDAGREELSKNG